MALYEDPNITKIPWFKIVVLSPACILKCPQEFWKERPEGQTTAQTRKFKCLVEACSIQIPNGFAGDPAYSWSQHQTVYWWNYGWLKNSYGCFIVFSRIIHFKFLKRCHIHRGSQLSQFCGKEDLGWDGEGLWGWKEHACEQLLAGHVAALLSHRQTEGAEWGGPEFLKRQCHKRACI